MKTIYKLIPAFTSAIILASCNPVYAESVSSICNSQMALAESVMQSRQGGVPLSKMLEISNNPQLKPIRSLFLELTKMAYVKPMHDSEKDKRKSIVEFKEYMQVICLRAHGTM